MLLLHPTLPAPDDPDRRRAFELAEGNPWTRITALAADAATSLEPWWEHGIEVALYGDDREGWLAQRAHHYDCVITSGLPDSGTLTAVRAHQPQAALLDGWLDAVAAYVRSGA